MGEGDGAGPKGNDRTDVGHGVHEGDRQEILHILYRQLRGFADAECPQGEDIQQAKGKLDEANGPGEREHVQGLLVVDVVANVEQIPQEEERANFKRGGGWLGCGGGTATGGNQRAGGNDRSRLQIVDSSGLDGSDGREAGSVPGGGGESTGGGRGSGGGFGKASAGCVNRKGR